MILKKKNIIIYNYKKYQNKIFYFCFNKNIKLLIHLLKCLLNRYKIISKGTKYFYTLKLQSVVSYIVELYINYFIEFIFSFNNFTLLGTLKNHAQPKHLYSVLRSPFVYKKSMEQFYYNSYKLKYKTNVTPYNFFLKKLSIFLNKNRIKKKFCF
jgi:hypothetical protein